MKALVLAGGEGTRLRPLTHARPKVLVPVLNRPLLEYTIERLRQQGIDDIILALGHMAKPVQAHFGDGSAWGVRLRYVVEEEPLGSGGAIKNVAAEFTDTFVVLNGDIYTDLDLAAMLAFHRQNRALLTIALTEVDDPSAYGVADVGPGGRLRRFIEKPPPGEAPSNLVNAGTWVCEPPALARIPAGRSMVEYDLFPQLLAASEPVYGYVSNAYWMDIGTLQSYLRLNRDLLSARPSEVAPDTQMAPTALIDGPVLIGHGCMIDEGVRIIGPTTLGDGCTIRDDSIIEACVLWDNVHVGRQVMLRRCVLASGCIVADGATLVGQVLVTSAITG